MPDGIFTEIEQTRTADEVVRQIELLLLDGVLSSGDRLPGERELAEKLDISRPVLREALKELERRELLVSRHGGGTFVADLIGQVFSRPVAELISRHPRATRDYLEYRRELEGYASELAAHRATVDDRSRLNGIVVRMRAAHEAGDFDSEMDADIDLHNAIGEAAHNVVLMHTLRACYRLLSEGIFHHRKRVFDLPGAREKLLSQHQAIVDGIASQSPADARRAAEAHIDFVVASAQEASSNEERRHIAALRAARADVSRGSSAAGSTSEKGKKA